jgi:hypothetical protein
MTLTIPNLLIAVAALLTILHACSLPVPIWVPVLLTTIALLIP